ncbi:hypothetical protein TNCV_32611 [Trichonephila clavipes]|nr:hypothetical protein TNCV_32611 [Trichonephila clavipes]
MGNKVWRYFSLLPRFCQGDPIRPFTQRNQFTGAATLNSLGPDVDFKAFRKPQTRCKRIFIKRFTVSKPVRKRCRRKRKRITSLPGINGIVLAKRKLAAASIADVQ